MNEFFRNIFVDMNLSFWSISTINATDIIDILIVTYLIYKVIVWIKETRAWSLFKGIVVVLFVSVMAYVLKLHTILWVVQNTLGVGLMAIIVLFQPELRKALEQLGKGKIVSPFNSSGDHGTTMSADTITAVTRAITAMSKEKTGAIIVIEQDVPLGDHISTGISIDAVVSSQLLINIFEDKTPLHDGAIIIRDNRIAAATCILPLTNDEIGKDLGTRHRAAVGVSEVSDGIAVVVSEETGAISLAIGGKLHRGLSAHDVKKMLSDNAFTGKKKKLLLWKGEHKNV